MKDIISELLQYGGQYDFIFCFASKIFTDAQFFGGHVRVLMEDFQKKEKNRGPRMSWKYE